MKTLEKVKKLLIEYTVAIKQTARGPTHRVVAEKILSNVPDGDRRLVEDKLDRISTLKWPIKIITCVGVTSDFLHELPLCFAEEIAGDVYDRRPESKPATLSDNGISRMMHTKSLLLKGVNSRSKKHYFLTKQVVLMLIEEIRYLYLSIYRVLVRDVLIFFISLVFKRS
jgi:hypothetical protein